MINVGFVQFESLVGLKLGFGATMRTYQVLNKVMKVSEEMIENCCFLYLKSYKLSALSICLYAFYTFNFITK